MFEGNETLREALDARSNMAAALFSDVVGLHAAVFPLHCFESSNVKSSSSLEFVF